MITLHEQLRIVQDIMKKFMDSHPELATNFQNDQLSNLLLHQQQNYAMTAISFTIKELSETDKISKTDNEL